MKPYSHAPSADELAVARAVARRRNEMNRGGSNMPTESATVEQRFHQHYVGALAEIAVSRIFNLSWSGCGKGSEGLFDVGNLLEVRSITDRGRNLLVRSKDLAKKNSPMVLAYVADDEQVDLVGWEFIGDAVENGRKVDGAKPYWLVDQAALRHCDELKAYVLEWIWSTN